MNGLRRIEATAWITGVALTIGCWLFGSHHMALGAGLGALFASINFRLLVWSWSSYMDVKIEVNHPTNEFDEKEGSASVENKEQTETGEMDLMGFLPKFLIKYAFLLIGIFLLVGGLRLHFVGCLIGMGNVVLAASLSPLILKLGPQTPHVKRGQFEEQEKESVSP